MFMQQTLMTKTGRNMYAVFHVFQQLWVSYSTLSEPNDPELRAQHTVFSKRSLEH